MPVSFPLPLLPNTHKTQTTFGVFFCNAGHPVLLKYSLCLSLGWGWHQMAVCALSDNGHAPLSSSPVARLGGGTGQSLFLGDREGSGLETSSPGQHQSKADSRGGRGGLWGPCGMAKQVRAGGARAWPVLADAVREHRPPRVTIVPSSL